MNDYKSNRKLFWLAVVILLACLGVTAFAVWYTLSTQSRTARQLEDIKKQLGQYDIPEDKVDVTPAEANYLLAVAQYCDAKDECRGPRGYIGIQGAQGIPGLQGVQGVPGLQGERGIPGEKGDKGDTGEQGAPGADGLQGPAGPKTQTQCNQDTGNIEVKADGDESWQPLYKLAPGQTCATEEL